MYNIYQMSSSDNCIYIRYHFVYYYNGSIHYVTSMLAYINIVTIRIFTTHMCMTCNNISKD